MDKKLKENGPKQTNQVKREEKEEIRLLSCEVLFHNQALLISSVIALD